MKNLKRTLPALLVCTLLVTFGLSACGNRSVEDAQTAQDSGNNITSENSEDSTFDFVDAQGQYHFAELQDWELSPYDKSLFLVADNHASYTGDPDYTYRNGIDVSVFQGDIDWQKVKADGYDFTFLRIGFRGYGESGSLNADTAFAQNYAGAKAAGLDIGVYFFSQAINEEEAVEEADYVLDLLAGVGATPEDLALPVVFDPESILDDEARTDDVTGEQFTRNTIAFFNTIEENGYTAAIYCNLVWEAYKLDLSRLQDHMVWYADYEFEPQTPYAFEIWQYSGTGNVDGIDGDVDLDLWLVKSD